MIKKRIGTKFIKEVGKPDEMIRLMGFCGGILEIGQTYVRFLDTEKAGKRLDDNT